MLICERIKKNKRKKEVVWHYEISNASIPRTRSPIVNNNARIINVSLLSFLRKKTKSKKQNLVEYSKYVMNTLI
jgi:hypothetical protein